MPQELLDLLARLREPGETPLTDAELATLLDGLAAYAGELRDAERTDENVAALRETAEAVTQVRTEQAARAEQAAERDRQAQEALDAIEQATAEPEPETEGETAEGEGGETAETEPEGETAETREPVAAAARPAARPSLGGAQRRVPAGNRPRPREDADQTPRATGSLVAAGDIPGYSAGQPIPSTEALSEAMARKLRALSHMKDFSAVVASVQTSYPDERMLRQGDAEGNDRKIRQVTDMQAIVAAGGVCSPVAVDYSVPVFASSDRPVRDALPRFGADRGGVTFNPPPDISVASAGTAIWTEANDVNPTSPATKPVYTVVCPSPTTVLVDAIPTRLKIGNMAGRFSPEWVGANTANALAFAARTAEDYLLGQIKAGSQVVTLSPTVGASRGLLEAVDQALAAMTFRHRLAANTRFRAILPAWARNMIRTDIAREIAHDAAGRDPLAIADAIIDNFFAARNVNVTWHLDGVAADATTGGVYAAQTFGTQATDTALAAYPAQVVFPLFPEGTWQHLDGGELNLGVVRDSTLDSTNDYETFVETFEQVAKRGIESLWLDITVAPTGASAGTVTPAYP